MFQFSNSQTHSNTNMLTEGVLHSENYESQCFMILKGTYSIFSLSSASTLLQDFFATAWILWVTSLSLCFNPLELIPGIPKWHNSLLTCSAHIPTSYIAEINNDNIYFQIFNLSQLTNLNC